MMYSHAWRPHPRGGGAHSSGPGGEWSRRPKVLRVALPGLTPGGFLDYCRMLYSK
jgi:hypothetical protein